MDTSAQQFKPDAIVRLYCAAWGEADAAKRRSMFEQVFTENAQYIDPKVQFTNWAQLDDYIGTLHQSFPRCRIALTSAVDSHNGVARFEWQFITQDGVVRNDGVDFVEFSKDGKLQEITGFFGPLKFRPE